VCRSCSEILFQLPKSETQPVASPDATVVRAVRARPASRIGGTPSTNRAWQMRSNPAPTKGVAARRVERRATAWVLPA
jgi:hypothetical protein